jgi:hypothetical protein
MYLLITTFLNRLLALRIEKLPYISKHNQKETKKIVQGNKDNQNSASNAEPTF